MRKPREQWIDANEAARILSEKSNHLVSSDYVRVLAKKELIRSRAKDGRTKEYHKGDVESYQIKPHKQQNTDQAVTTENKG